MAQKKFDKMIKPPTIKKKDIYDRPKRTTVCPLCKGSGLSLINPLLRCMLCDGYRMI